MARTLVSHPRETTDFAHWEFALLYPKDKQASMHWDGTYRDRKSPVGGYDDPSGFTDYPYPDPSEWFAKHLAAAKA